MPGVPDPPFLSVEGPEFAERVRAADALTRRLEQHTWDFAEAPEIFGLAAACDVAAKEIVSIHDGQTQTRFGRLIMKGVGTRFSLTSHESPRSVYLGARPDVFKTINSQIGSEGLLDSPEFKAFGAVQRVELYNPTLFYQL